MQAKCVAPDLSFGKDNSNAIKVSGVFGKKAQIKSLGSVLLTHIDCDHANGLKQVKGAKKFILSADEVKFVGKLTNRVALIQGLAGRFH